MSDCPNLIDYSKFLWNVVEVDEDNLPPFQATGNLEATSNVLTLTAIPDGQTVTLDKCAIVTDSQNSIPPWPPTTIAEQLSGWPPSGEVGTYQLSVPALTTVTGVLVTGTNNWIVTTLEVAKAIVNPALACTSPKMYELAVYNLGADRLINFAQDQPNQSYWRDRRKDMRIYAPSLGVPEAGSDQGTSGSLVNPEVMKNLTLANLQQLKTPFGREYLGIAQSFGPYVVGLT